MLPKRPNCESTTMNLNMNLVLSSFISITLALETIKLEEVSQQSIFEILKVFPMLRNHCSKTIPPAIISKRVDNHLMRNLKIFIKQQLVTYKNSLRGKN